MTVYVDAAVHPWQGRMWCHVFSSDLDELHGFARRLGLRRSWFQHPPFASWPHYDTTAKRRPRAIGLGAVEADRRTTVRVAEEARLAWHKLQESDPGVAAVPEEGGVTPSIGCPSTLFADAGQGVLFLAGRRPDG